MNKSTRALMEEVVREAFKKGELWGETYATWFEPTKEDQERKIKEAIDEILGKIQE